MQETNWPQLWDDAKKDPYHHLVLSLLMVNGLPIDQIRQLHTATITADGQWLTTANNETFPITAHAHSALHAIDSDLSPQDLATACDQYTVYEDDAHRRLSGALWFTDEQLQITMETMGTADAPILPLRFMFPFSVVERLEPGETSDIARNARETLQIAADWLVEQTLSSNVPLPQRILGLLRQGSLIFLIASTGVSGLNLIHNVLMGRLLSPADYSQLTFVITLQLLVGLLPSAIQTVTARFSARYNAQADVGLFHALRQQTHSFGWLVGIVTAVGLLIASPILINLFQLDGIGLLLPVIIAVPFFVRTGADRGLLQGLGSYFWLSGAYVSEGFIRLVMSVILGYGLLDAGRSLDGTIWAVAQSMVITWLIGWLALQHLTAADEPTEAPAAERAEWQQLGRMTALVLIGQALITNSDFLLVKNFFTPEDAGLYAAVSVLGRIVYFGALPLTILLVPLVAKRQALNQPTRPILMLLIGGGGAVCGALVLMSALFASDILGLLYGEEYVSAANLLAPYALAASLYTLTNLVITYQIALGSGGETWMPIIAGSLQIIGVLILHDTLTQVITIQIVLMGLLFGVVLWRVLAPGADDNDLPIAGATSS